MSKIIQLKVTLKHSKPPIWRRILVESDCTFDELHFILQDTMGWHNCHLYEFELDGVRFVEPEESNGLQLKDANECEIGDYLSKVKQKMTYTYDFGDNWGHTVLVEDFLEKDPMAVYPVCTAGKLECPPEDCGGIHGFYHLLEILNDEKHPEHEDMKDWLGEDYDPKHFDKAEINARLF